MGDEGGLMTQNWLPETRGSREAEFCLEPQEIESILSSL